jgi:hypothetical protein
VDHSGPQTGESRELVPRDQTLYPYILLVTTCSCTPHFVHASKTTLYLLQNLQTTSIVHTVAISRTHEFTDDNKVHISITAPTNMITTV